MSRPTQLFVVLAVAFLLYWPLRGAKLALAQPVPMATITYRLPVASFRQSLFQLCEKWRCPEGTPEEQVIWASDKLTKLASTWEWKDLASLDATVTVEVEE